MKQMILWIMALLLAGCVNQEERLRQRAAELCKYVPDHELSAQSKDYMTADFYAVLDTLFNLPEHEAMDHEWLYYFVTGNGGTIADFEVVGVQQTDETHAVATVLVRQKWEDGTMDSESNAEEHHLYMEYVDGQWLMSDFDKHKADCLRHIAINRREQTVRAAISDYLVREIGAQYLQGELCIPMLLIAAEDDESKPMRVWGDFWVFWYNQVGDTLKTVSGGSHPGLLTLSEEDGRFAVTGFERVEDGSRFQSSAQRIFGKHFDVFQNMHSNEDVREAVRKEQLQEYVQQHSIPVRYYQDYGWPAVEL